MQSVMILGRQPELGLAELESLYGPAVLRTVGNHAAVVDVDPCLLAFDRLGGSVKFCKLLTTLDTTNWRDIEKFLLQVSPGHSERLPEGKLLLGLSVIGFDTSPRQLEATGLSIKKVIRKTGRPVRLVPNKSPELNAAQVIHNKLTGPNGWELVFIRDGSKTIVAQTVKVQGIESYTRRDRERPKRDAKVGMLPPKLAQIILNLSAGKLAEETLKNICDIPADQEIPLVRLDQQLLDPFCGTGVLLQEAALMGYDVYGTDLEPRMIEYSERNLGWLGGTYRLPPVCCRLEAADATDHAWEAPVDIVAAETYLGRPFTSPPDAETLARTVSDCNLILKKFLKNIAPQLKSGTRLCLAVPAWQTRRGQFKHLPLIDQISELGYNRVSFEHIRDEQLLYYREDQIVARQLIVITRK
jgi:SAM-dependent methyltransferase